MSSEAHRFDAYFKWLRIHKRHQPPTHYRLLGINEFESDTQVIEEAAVRQSEHVRKCGQQKFPDIAERILQEIEAARQCLLDPEQKAAYDEKLKAQPKQKVLTPHKTRYDALQVSDLDAKIAENAPPAPAKSSHSDTQPSAAAASSDARKSKPPAEKLESSEHRQAKRGSRTVPAAPIPPVVEKSSGDENEPEVNTALVVKLTVGGCILAGGITYGLLHWMSSPPPAETDQAPIVAPADSEPAGAADVTAATESAADATGVPAASSSANPVATAQENDPAASRTKQAAEAPARSAEGQQQSQQRPAASASTNQFAGTHWQIISSKVAGIMTLHADGSLTISGLPQKGTWRLRSDEITGRFMRDSFRLKKASDDELTGTYAGASVKAYRVSEEALREIESAMKEKDPK